MARLNQFGSVVTAYAWTRRHPEVDRYQPSADAERLFLATITAYTYPEEEKYLTRAAALRHVTLTFRPDGYASDERVTKRGFGEPSNVETREFRGVDVSANWLDVPEFGDWIPLFFPDPTD